MSVTAIDRWSVPTSTLVRASTSNVIACPPDQVRRRRPGHPAGRRPHPFQRSAHPCDSGLRLLGVLHGLLEVPARLLLELLRLRPLLLLLRLSLGELLLRGGHRLAGGLDALELLGQRLLLL